MSNVVIAKPYYAAQQLLSEQEAARAEHFIRVLLDAPGFAGIGLERMEGVGNPNFWSARLSRDLQVLLHHDRGRLIVLYAGSAVAVNAWAKCHSIERHEVTGALQIVAQTERGGSSESARGSAGHNVPVMDPVDFRQYDAQYLLSLGVPPEWLLRVRTIRTEGEFYEISDLLPEEAAEHLYDLVIGRPPVPSRPSSPARDAVEAPDSRRRFHVVTDLEELQDYLRRPFREWMLYLHPSQRSMVEGEFNGPLKVTGAAGTGKTVVAIHRAAHLARAGRKVLLTSYTNRLCSDIRGRVADLCKPDVGERITVQTVHSTALELVRKVHPKLAWMRDEDVDKLFDELRPKGMRKKSLEFARQEWDGVLAIQGLVTWQEYRDAQRTGRGRPLSTEQREELWPLFEAVLKKMYGTQRLPWGMICRLAREELEAEKITSPFEAVIVDEVQDLNPQEIALLAALTGERKELVLVGDAGQRIYPGGFSLRSLGIEVRGRSRKLTINYRTTGEIERFAARIRGKSVDDLDEGTEESAESHCVLRGQDPLLRGFGSYEEENTYVADEISRLISEGASPSEIAVFARTTRHYYYILQALRSRNIPCTEANSRNANTVDAAVCFSTMHGAKGLEFRFVFIVSCRDHVIPANFELKQSDDPIEQEATLQRERNLLYVSLTRARDQVYVTWTGDCSRFLQPYASADLFTGDRKFV